MATSVNNGVSEERFGKPLKENGDCASLVPPNYKRRKVSAIRDFPEGCGPLASRIDPVSKEDIADLGSANGTLVENTSAENLGDAAARTSKREDDLRHSELKESILTETLVENKSAENLVDAAARTSKCEHDLQHSELKESILTETLVENKSAENLVFAAARTSKCEDDLRHSELKESILTETLGKTIDCSLKEENSSVPSHQVDGPTVANDEAAQGPLPDMKSLDTKFESTVNSVKCESSNVSKSFSQVGEVAMSGGSKSLSPRVNIDGSRAFMEETVTRRYLPRRKVSAVRDFPSFCGRNAPRLSQDEYVEVISLNNKGVGEQNLTVHDNPLKNVSVTDVKEVQNNVQDEYGCKRKLVDVLPSDSERDATKRVKKLENTRETDANHFQVKITSKAAMKAENQDGIRIEGASGVNIMVHPEVENLETKPLDTSTCQRNSKRNFNELQVASGKQVVLGVMCKSECPWRSDKGSSKVVPSKVILVGGTNESKGKKMDFYSRFDNSKTAIKTKGALNHSGQQSLKKKTGDAVSDGKGRLVIPEKKDSLDPNDNIKKFKAVPKSCDVYAPPVGRSDFSGHESDSNVIRIKVRESLRLFQAVSRKLLQEIEAKSDGQGKKPDDRGHRRIDLQAAKLLKDKGKYVNAGKQIMGPVPGVEVGDEFQYRVELNIIGLHRPIQGGIDYVKHNGKILATSVVASGGYADELDNSDVLIYTGQGGNVMNSGKDPEDQKLERGNLALKNSSEEKNPVRVIRGSDSTDGKSNKTYVYDGLYLVESCWQDMGPHGKLVYKFRLRRIPGQPELALREVKKSKKFKTREGLCVDDISYGKERIPICAVNTIDGEKPPPFEYITSMIYPDCNLVPPEGCDCTNGCSDSEKCSCALKNGGEIPFNHDGAIVEAKHIVYECGPYCKCPSTCPNRVSQHGLKFQLEIFKTATRGWGVRSLNSIPSGSFICEYMGELLEDKEAEQRTGNDEYLFDIGNSSSNSNLWDGLSTLMPGSQSNSHEVVKDGGFTIDAAKFGNVGRFINHSCSPNLYAQDVLYDHHDIRMPHIMFFAAENIPPLQELCYDYNYAIDQVRDSDGNIKKKDCYCGSVECTGRMY